ncbi:hypothetical protein ACFLV3_06750 [Chloroflexota bacterium]
MGNILLSRARYILAKKGLPALIKRGTLYFIRITFFYGTFYLYEHTIKERKEEEYLPRIDKFTFVIINEDKQVRKMIDKGFENIYEAEVRVDVRKCLENGAIAFCFFINKELAHIGWVALNEQAKNCFDIVPYYVDFFHGQACTGGTVTLPKYGGKGFMQYGYYQRFEFLRRKSYKTSRNSVAKGNIAAEKAHGKFLPRIYAKGKLIRLFKWTYWKQTPLE